MHTRSKLALTAAAFDAWPSECAVLAPDGTILLVNEAWRRYGDENGAGALCGPGADYLRVTQRAADTGDDVAGVVLASLTAVLSGNAPRARLDYPCHSPDQQRWFRLTAEPLPGRPEVLVVHDDITHLTDITDITDLTDRTAPTGWAHGLHREPEAPAAGCRAG